MKAKKVITTIVGIILILVILLAAGFAFVTLATHDINNVASIAGYTPLTVQSDSMVPTFKTGDLIIIKKCDPAELEVGDIITFYTIIENKYALNTHRIESIEETGGLRSYTTKGDNNEISDRHVIMDNDIVGKYAGKIAGAGKVVDFLSSPLGFLLVIVLPMFLFFAYQVYHLITVAISLKKATALETAAEAGSTEEALKAKEAELQAALEETKRLKAEIEAQYQATKSDIEQKTETVDKAVKDIMEKAVDSVDKEK